MWKIFISVAFMTMMSSSVSARPLLQSDLNYFATEAKSRLGLCNQYYAEIDTQTRCVNNEFYKFVAQTRETYFDIDYPADFNQILSTEIAKLYTEAKIQDGGPSRTDAWYAILIGLIEGLCKAILISCGFSLLCIGFKKALDRLT